MESARELTAEVAFLHQIRCVSALRIAYCARRLHYNYPCQAAYRPALPMPLRTGQFRIVHDALLRRGPPPRPGLRPGGTDVGAASDQAAGNFQMCRNLLPGRVIGHSTILQPTAGCVQTHVPAWPPSDLWAAPGFTAFTGTAGGGLAHLTAAGFSIHLTSAVTARAGVPGGRLPGNAPHSPPALRDLVLRAPVACTRTAPDPGSGIRHHTAAADAEAHPAEVNRRSQHLQESAAEGAATLAAAIPAGIRVAFLARQ